MEEAKRRRVCRWAFLIMVLAPCGALLAFSGWRASAWHEETVQRRFRELLGVDATWTGLAFPAPGEMRFEGLRLCDANSGEVLASAERFALYRADGPVRATASEIVIPGAATPRIARVLATLNADSLGNWQLDGGEIQVVDANGKLRAMAAIAKAESWTAEGVRRTLFRFRSGRDQWASEMKLEVACTAADRKTRITLDTNQSKLPLRSAGAIWPPLIALGDKATFEGQASVERRSLGWDGEARGILDEIDLDRLVTDHTKQRLQGVGTLSIESARFERGKLVEATGRFGADDGIIGMGLLSDVAGYFKTGVAPSLPTKVLLQRAQEVPFSEIRITYHIHGNQLNIAGVSTPGEAWIRDADGEALLFGPQQTPCTPSIIVNLLFPTSSPRIAAADEPLWLAGWLPLPSASQLAEFVRKQPQDRNSLRAPAGRNE